MIWLLPIIAFIGAVIATIKDIFPEKQRSFVVLAGLVVAATASGFTIYERNQSAQTQLETNEDLEKIKADLETSNVSLESSGNKLTDLNSANTALKTQVTALDAGLDIIEGLLKSTRDDLFDAKQARRETEILLKKAEAERADAKNRLEELQAVNAALQSKIVELGDSSEKIATLARCERIFQPIQKSYTAIYAIQNKKTMKFPNFWENQSFMHPVYLQRLEYAGFNRTSAAISAADSSLIYSKYQIDEFGHNNVIAIGKDIDSRIGRLNNLKCTISFNGENNFMTVSVK